MLALVYMQVVGKHTHSGVNELIRAASQLKVISKIKAM